MLSEKDFTAIWDALPGIEIHNKAAASGQNTNHVLRMAFATAVAEAAVKDAVGGDKPAAYLWHENGRPVAASLVPTTRPDRMCLPLYTRPKARAVIASKGGAA